MTMTSWCQSFPHMFLDLELKGACVRSCVVALGSFEIAFRYPLNVLTRDNVVLRSGFGISPARPAS